MRDCGNCGKKTNRPKYCSNSCGQIGWRKSNLQKIKDYSKYYNQKTRQSYIPYNPQNGITIDVTDMMERNNERFNHGLKLNL